MRLGISSLSCERWGIAQHGVNIAASQLYTGTYNDVSYVDGKLYQPKVKVLAESSHESAIVPIGEPTTRLELFSCLIEGRKFKMEDGRIVRYCSESDQIIVGSSSKYNPNHIEVYKLVEYFEPKWYEGDLSKGVVAYVSLEGNEWIKTFVFFYDVKSMYPFVTGSTIGPAYKLAKLESEMSS